MKRLLLVLFILIFTVPAYATDFDFFGQLQYHNEILSWDVTTDASTVTVFTSSWDDGNFDPELQVWNTATGALIHQQDDGHNVGSTMSNGVSYDHGNWDTYYSLDLGAGTYTLTLTTYHNYASGTNLSDPQFAYDSETPIPMSTWNQPANGIRGDYYEVHFLGATEVIDNNNPVPEPATMLLFGLGLLGLAGVNRKK